MNQSRLTGLYHSKLFIPVVLTILSFWCALAIGVDLRSLAEGIPNIIDFIVCMFPPELSILPRLVGPAVQTVQMAFLGTLVAAMISFPLAMLAARNITSSKLARNLSKGLIAVTRTVPDIIFALIFISAVGLGPFPGVLAISIHSVGMLGKLYAESIEEIDPHPVEALEAVGADKVQTIIHAVIPQVMPSFIADTLYRLDINVRSSVVLGLVGAGGIGFELIYDMRLFRYRELASVLFITFVIIILTERISDRLRQRVIGEEVLK
jgi:phosphonate transport system permease protein